MWRYIESKEYGGYSIQKHHIFLWWEWWTNEYLCTDEQETKRFILKIVNT